MPEASNADRQRAASATRVASRTVSRSRTALGKSRAKTTRGKTAALRREGTVAPGSNRLRRSQTSKLTPAQARRNRLQREAASTASGRQRTRDIIASQRSVTAAARRQRARGA